MAGSLTVAFVIWGVIDPASVGEVAGVAYSWTMTHLGWLFNAVATIVLMITLDAVHPPAVATSLAFAFRAGEASNLTLFALAVGITALLVILERVALWQLVRIRRRRGRG